MKQQDLKQSSRNRVAAFLGMTTVFLLLALMMKPAAAQSVLGNQAVHDNGGPWGAVLNFPSHENVPSDLAAGQIAGDDFTLSQQTIISEITWFGLYGTTYGDPLDLFQGGLFLDAPAGGTTEGYQDDFTLALYKIVGGLPEATPLKSWDIGDVPEEPWVRYAVGLDASFPPYVRANYFRYKVDFPIGERVILDPGSYLLTIYNDNPKSCVYAVDRECTLFPEDNQPLAWEWADSINSDTDFYPTPSSFKSPNPGAGDQANWQAVPGRELSWILTDNAVNGARPYTYYDMWSDPYRIEYQAVGGELYDVDFICSLSGRIFTSQPETKMAFFNNPDGAADASLAINGRLSQFRPTSDQEITEVSFIRYRSYCSGRQGWTGANAQAYYLPFAQPVVETAVGWENSRPSLCNDLYGERRWCNVGSGGIDGFDVLAEATPDPEDPTFAYMKKSRFTADPPDTIHDLIAGGGNPSSALKVGSVHVKPGHALNDLFVVYEITEPGWCLSEVHAHVAATLDQIPQTRKGIPKVGLFDYSDDSIGCQKSATFGPISFGGVDAPFVVAAHAVVQTEGAERSETAWGAGVRFPGANWAMAIQVPGGS